MIPLMPSPGRPNTVSTPQSMSRSTSDSEAILPMAAPRPESEGALPGSFPRGDRTNEGGGAGRRLTRGVRGTVFDPAQLPRERGGPGHVNQRARLTQEPTLATRNPHGPQGLVLGPRLDPLRGDGGAALFREGDERGHHGAADRVAVDVVRERDTE